VPPSADLTPVERMRATFDLVDLTERMFRHRLRREHPDWSPAELDAHVTAWYHTRPGAEHGDAQGLPGRWPRR
jgi:hypothetical protein